MNLEFERGVEAGYLDRLDIFGPSCRRESGLSRGAKPTDGVDDVEAGLNGSGVGTHRRRSGTVAGCDYRVTRRTL